MRHDTLDCLPVEITYSILKPFLAGADQDSLELPPYFEIDPRSGVSGRSVAVHVVTRLPSCRERAVQWPFEEIEFSLHGVIKSEVGNKIARRKILQSVQLRRWSDFNKHHRGKNIPSHQLGEEYYCDINFPINPTRGPNDTTSPQLLPSMSLSSSKYVTQPTALHDQHRISGSCDVVYWIEARFIPSTASAGFIETPVRIVSSSALNLKHSSNRVRLALPRSSQKEENRCFEVEAKSSNALRMKRQCQALFSGSSRQSQTQPRIMFSIPNSSSSEYALLTTSASTSTFVVPLTMTVFIPPTTTSTSSSDALKRCLTSSGFSNTVTLNSTWTTTHKFTTNPSSTTSDEDTIEKHTAHREAHTLKFPPFYESTASQYTATVDLEVSVPAGLPVTSNYGLLAIRHFLSIGVRIGEEEKSSTSSHSSSNAAFIHAAGMAADMQFECIVET